MLVIVTVLGVTLPFSNTSNLYSVLSKLYPSGADISFNVYLEGLSPVP